MVAAGELLRRCVRAALLPRARVPIDEWCDRFVRIPEKDQPEPGPWRTDRTPFIRRPMRLFAREGAPSSLALMFSSQTAKTACLDNCKLWTVAQRPGPTLVMYGTVEYARDYNQDRFQPLLELCAPVAAELLPSPQDNKQLKISFRGMTMWFVGSNAKGGRRQRSIRYVVCDEVETYEDADWVEVLERGKAFAGAKKVFASTAGDEDAGIDRLYKQGSMERYWVPCPHCGAFQVLVFGNLKWDGGGHGGSELVEMAKATARYECRAPGCGSSIYDHHKPAMLRRGVWIAGKDSAGLKTLTEDRARGLDADAKDPPDFASFQLSSLYSPLAGATFGDMAGQFVSGGGQVTPEFVRGWIGEPWKVQGDRVELDELRALCAPVSAGGYRLRTVPGQAVALVMTVDVQKDRCYVEVRAWGPFGRDTWLVDCYTVARTEGADLVELDDEAKVPRVYRIASFAEGGGGGEVRTMRVRAEGIDSGYFTCEVYQYVRRQKARRVTCFAMKGADGGFRAPHQLTAIERFPEGSGHKWAGKPIPGGVVLLVFSNDVWKTAAVGRMKGRPETPEERDGATEGKTDPAVLPGFYLPDNSGGELEDYLVQLTSEHRAKKLEKRKGARRAPVKGALYEWQRRPGREDNHYFDTCVMNFALADNLGIRKYSGRAVERKSGGVKGERQSSGWVSGARHE